MSIVWCCSLSQNMEENVSKEVHQFAKKVHHFSSQYGSETSISYTVRNLAGMVNKYPHYGDFTQACVFRTYGPWWTKAPSAVRTFPKIPDSFNSVDFVELIFEEAVIPTAIEIFETYNPGAVVRILAYLHHSKPQPFATGPNDCWWTTLWYGCPERAPPVSRIFYPPLKKVEYPTNMIRLELNSSLCHYYTELDGVRLSGIESPYPLPDPELHSFNGRPADYDTALREYGTPVDPFPDPSRNAPTNEMLHTYQPQKSSTSTCDKEQSNIESQTFKSCSESLAIDLSRLHINDGLSAALDTTDNGYFDLLPGEIVQGIFSYLDIYTLCQLAQTCRLLREHCYDPLLYTELSLKHYWSRISDESLTDLQSRCRFTQRIDLSWCGNYALISSIGLDGFLSKCGSTLTTLHLSCCGFVQDASISVIVKNCQRLEDLDLQCIRCVALTSQGFRELKNLKHLRKLNLYRTFIDTSSLCLIISNFKNLEYLNVGSCASVNDFDEVASHLAKFCNHLKYVDLWRARTLSDLGLRALVNACPELEEIDIGWCPNVRSGTGIFVDLAKCCPKLKKLFLTANRTVSDADVYALSQFCPLLEQLDILGTREVSAMVSKKLLEQCGSLKFFDVSFCHGISSEVVNSWEELYPHVDIKRSFQT